MTIKKSKIQKPSTVSDKDAEASAPENYSIAGEEDPGVALEQWVYEQNKAREQAEKTEPEKTKK